MNIKYNMFLFQQHNLELSTDVLQEMNGHDGIISIYQKGGNSVYKSSPPPPQAMQRVFMPPSCLAGPYFLWFWVHGERKFHWWGSVGTKGRARKWGPPYRINHAARTEGECVGCRVRSSFI
jgi:hypothetical protein